MSELRDLTAALTRQRRRLKELIELCGREDPEHPRLIHICQPHAAGCAETPV